MVESTCRIGGTALIGYTPENDARLYRFNIEKWQKAWPDASPKMLVVRPGEDEAYPVRTRVEGHEIVWTAMRYDTAIPGTGRMWVVFYGADGQQLGLTPMTTTKIVSGPPNIEGEEPPESSIPWVEDVFLAADRAQDAAERAEEIAEALAGGGGGNLDSGLFLPPVDEDDNGKVLTVVDGKWSAETLSESGGTGEDGGGGGILNGIVDVVEKDNMNAVTSNAVYNEFSVINALLQTI